MSEGGPIGLPSASEGAEGSSDPAAGDSLHPMEVAGSARNAGAGARTVGQTTRESEETRCHPPQPADASR